MFWGAVPIMAGRFKRIWTDRCPLTKRYRGPEPWMIEVFRAVRVYNKSGALPLSGGWLEQPAALMEAIEAVTNEYDAIQTAEREVRDRKREAQDALKKARAGK